MPVNKITFYGFEQFTSMDFMPKIIEFHRLKSEKRTEGDLKNFVEFMFSLKMDFEEHDESLPECVFCAEKENNVIVVELKPQGGMTSPIEIVDQVSKIFNPNMFVVMAEAWSLDKHPGDGNRISEHPDKKECFLLDGRTMGGGKYSEFYHIENNNGKREYKKEDMEHSHLDCRYDDPGER